MRIKTPSTSSSCTNNTFVTNELSSFGAAKTRTMILEQDYRFKTTATCWRECMEQLQLSIPDWKPAQKDTLGNRIKKYINKSLTRIFWANNDDIGICYWRNDGKSPVWITEWNQRRHQQFACVQTSPISSRNRCRRLKKALFYSQTRSSVPPKNTLINLLFKSWIRC